MSDGAMGGGGGAAPAAAPAAGTAPAAAPAGGAPAAAPVARTPILFKPADHDREFDVSEVVDKHLREHRRKVVIDGQESEVDIEAAFRAASMEPASKKRFDEAAAIRNRATSEMARIRAADAGMSDPVIIPSVLTKRLGGQEGYEKFILQQAKEILAMDEMTPAQRAEVLGRRKQNAEIAERTQKLTQKEFEQEQRDKLANEERQKTETARKRKEWPPLIKGYGIPDGFVIDVMNATGKELREARKLGIHLTEREAIGRAAAALKKKLPGEVPPPPPPTVDVVRAQPGRETRVEAPRTETGQFKKKNGVLRPGDVLDRIDRLGR